MRPPHGGHPDLGVLDLSASLHPLGPPEAVRRVLARAGELALRYPSPDAEELCQSLAKHHGVPAASVLAGNGSAELIYLVAQAEAGRPAHVVLPCFGEYTSACRAMGLPLVSEDRALVTFVANPSCPRGLLASGAGLRAGPGLRVVDEAFMGFTDERESLVDRAAHDPDLIVLRSLTKLYALPGLRIGYLVAHPERIARLRERQPPWSVNGLAQAAGIAAIGDVEYARRAPALVRELREALVRDLSSFGIAPEPSDANYVLCPVDRAGELCRRLLERRVAIRDCSSFEGLAHDRFVRIAVPDDAGRARLMRALEEIRA